MKKLIISMFVMMMLISMLPQVSYATEEVPFRFDDVQNEKSYYFDAVYWAYNSEPQITTGRTDSLFMPNDPCTRAEIVTFLWRFAKLPETKQKTLPFDDVAYSGFYRQALLWAYENGIAAGTSDTVFDPNTGCTRAQVVTFLWRLAGKPEPDAQSSKFTDLAPKKYYYKAVLWAAENNITNGMSETVFSPDGPCTRAQIVSLLNRFDGYDYTLCDHEYEYVEKISQSCTEKGYTKYICGYCGQEHKDDYVNALGHDMQQTNVIAPSCTNQGYSEYVCTVCGLTRRDNYVNALGHDMKQFDVFAPSCIDRGYTEYKCSRCGEIKKDNYTDALGHDYQNYKCTRCGERDPNAPIIYDVEEAMAVGNAYAQSLGYTIDYSLNLNNSSYRPGNDISGSYITSHGGQSKLNEKVKEVVQATYEWMLYAYGEPDGTRGRCYVVRYDNDVYDIHFLF